MREESVGDENLFWVASAKVDHNIGKNKRPPQLLVGYLLLLLMTRVA